MEEKFADGLGVNVFIRTQSDDRPGPVEDRKFIRLMEETIKETDTGNWTAPLPFRHEVTQLPNSRKEAYKRLRSTLKALVKKPLMKRHYNFEFMQKTLDNGHAEPVPKVNLVSAKPCWYLPHLEVYHPQKPEKIRVIFDSAAECDGVSLNKLLLSGPNSNNSLVGVLLRFWQNPVGFHVPIVHGQRRSKELSQVSMA